MAGQPANSENLTALSPEELLETLRSYPFLEKYSLALFCENSGLLAFSGPAFSLCGNDQPSFCGELCAPAQEKAVYQAMETRQPATFRCQSGLLNFAVPFPSRSQQDCCIIGGGVRNGSIDLEYVEQVAREKNLNGISFLERWERLPQVSEEELIQTAERTFQLIPDLQSDNLFALAFERTMVRLNAIVGISPELDRCPSVEAISDLVGETLTVLFDLSRAGMIILPEDRGGQIRLHPLVGWPEKSIDLSPRAVEALYRRDSSRRYHLSEEECLDLAPDIKAESVFCIPCAAEGEALAVLVIPDTTLHPRDLLLIELIAGRIGMRLLRLSRERERAFESSVSERLISLISGLANLKNHEELFQRILEASAELLHASKGSLMLLDASGENLHIEASRGMNEELARSMRVKVGTGIAGRVASNGHPLLVNDIEKDDRVRTPNRPRFKTKSFISVPLKVQDKVFAVLNLSDKEHEGAFSEEDLRLLTTFAPHFSSMIERAESLQQALQFEELSVTDPLTGLYNRRFLERRMEEEISRSMRQDLSLSVIIIDLDHFKNYNDLCGHLAGDRALKRTAHVLRRSARDMDIVTRYGGEEFCILLPGTSKKESLLVAERMRNSIDKESFPRQELLPFGRLTASMGIASFPADGNTAHALINAADIALYEAKTAGRNRTVLFEPGQHTSRSSIG